MKLLLFQKKSAFLLINIMDFQSCLNLTQYSDMNIDKELVHYCIIPKLILICMLKQAHIQLQVICPQGKGSNSNERMNLQ